MVPDQKKPALALIVDDDPVLRLLARESLESSGWNVEEAENGGEALATFQRCHPDVVLLDIGMPEMDGFTACAAIRKLPGGEHVPILIMTGLNDYNSITQAYDAGATDFLTKPLNGLLLTHRIRYILRSSRVLQELRASQISLAENERHLVFTQCAVDHAGDGILWADDSARFIYANDAACRMVGYAIEELLSLRVADIHPSFDPTLFQQRGDQVGERTAATYELVYQHKDGTEFPVEISVTFLEHNGQEYTCQILRDITERKRIEQERAQAMDDLHNVIETIPDIVFALNTEGNLVKWNRRLVDVTGYSSDELLNKPSLAFVPPEEQTRTAAAIQRAFTEGYAELDGQLLTKDLRTISYHWTGALLKSSHGESIGIIGIGRDVSDKKRAEEFLRKSEERLELAVEGSSDILWDASRLPGEPWYAPQTPIWWSPRVREFLGLKESELFETLEHWAARLHPDEKDRVFGRLTAHFEHRIPYDVEYRLRTNQGDYRWVRGRGQASFDEQGEVRRMSGSCQDITDLKQAEEALRTSEAKFRALAEETTDWMWEVNEQAAYTYCSPKIRDLLGYEPDEALGKTPFDFMPEEEARRVAGVFGPIAAARKPFSGLENTNRHKDGRLVVLECRGVPIIDPTGVFKGYRGFDQEITERKQSEEAVRLSEERFRAIFENAAVGIAVGSHTAGTGIDQVNPAFQSMTGYSSEELCRLGMKNLTHPDDLSASKAFVERLIAGDLTHGSIEKRYVRQDGSIMWAQTTVSSILDNQGNYKNSVAMIQDITDRKQVEEALIHNEHQLRTVLDALPVGVWFTDRSGNVLLANPAARQIWSGIKQVGIEESADGAGWWEAVGASSALHRWALSHALTRGVASLNESLDLECLDGTKKTIRNSTVPVQGEDGVILGAIVLNEDLSPLRQAQKALALTQFSVDHAVEGFFWVDPDARILSVNDAVCRMLEYTRDELTTMTVYDIDPNFTPDIWPAHWEAVKRKGSVTFESKYWSCTGLVMDTEITFNYLLHDGHEYNCAIVRDITERKRDEDLLRESEQAIRTLHDATAASGLSLNEQIQSVLEVGCRRFKLPISVITRVVGEELEFTHVYAPGTSFTAGMTVPLNTTYCQTTLQSTGPVCVEHAAKSDWRTHPGYKALGLECYIGTKLSGLAHMNGTICFLGEDPHFTTFSQADKDFLQLMARWISGELDRSESERVLRESEQAIRTLHEATATPGMSFDERIQAILEVGCRRFNLPIGVLTRIAGEELKLTHVYAPGTSFTAGMAVPVCATYCHAALQSTGVVCIEHAKNTDWRDHPGYKALGLECYIGVKMHGSTDTFGTICFMGQNPYHATFSQADQDLLQLMARWISGELDRLRSAQALAESEERYRALYDNTPTMYFTLATDGTVRSVNRFGADQLGYRVEELVGDSVLSIFHEDHRAAVAASLSACLAAPEKTQHWEFRKVRKDGHIIYVRETARVGQSSTGENVLLVTCEDVTDLKRVEEALRQRERDLHVAIEERERISQDLHDGVLQSLFAVGLGLEVSKSMMSSKSREKSGPPLDQAIDELNRVMHEIRNFITGLGSDLLQGKDLSTALLHMVKSLTQNQAMRVRLAVEDRAAKAVSVEQSMHLFLVIQEAVSNCLRHGRAKEARVSLKMLKQGVRLSIRDNGRGFNPETTKASGHGLVNMAARSKKIGGRFSIVSKENKGTSIILDLPKEVSDVSS